MQPPGPAPIYDIDQVQDGSAEQAYKAGCLRVSDYLSLFVKVDLAIVVRGPPLDQGWDGPGAFRLRAPMRGRELGAHIRPRLGLETTRE